LLTAVSVLLPVDLDEDTITLVLEPFEVEYSDGWGRGSWRVSVAPGDERHVFATDDTEDLEAMPDVLLQLISDVFEHPPLTMLTLIFESRLAETGLAHQIAAAFGELLPCAWWCASSTPPMRVDCFVAAQRVFTSQSLPGTRRGTSERTHSRFSTCPVR
jgi:hypothetical protein